MQNCVCGLTFFRKATLSCALSGGGGGGLYSSKWKLIGMILVVIS